MKKLSSVVVLGFCVAVVAGCDSQKGKDFEGHWTAGTAKAPLTLDIKYSGGVYHVDQTYKTIFTGDELYRNKLEATPLSEEVLEIRDGAGSTSMRLEKGHIFFDSEEYTKAQ